MSLFQSARENSSHGSKDSPQSINGALQGQQQVLLLLLEIWWEVQLQSHDLPRLSHKCVWVLKD